MKASVKTNQAVLMLPSASFCYTLADAFNYMKMKLICTFLFSLLLGNQVFAGSVCNSSFTYTVSNDTVTFTNTSTASFPIISYNWNFGDGSSDTAQHPEHIYQFGGYYIVTLSIVTNDSCMSSFTDTLLVNSSCDPSFSYAVNSNTGSVALTPAPANSAFQYSWNLGDGSNSNSMNVTKVYNPGTYYVCLSVTDTSGICTGTFCDTVVVPQRTCYSTFSTYQLGGYSYSLQATVVNAAFDYTWTFSEGGSDTGAYVNHSYAMGGYYGICLNIVDSSTGCSSTFCDSVLVIDTCNTTYNYSVSGLSLSAIANPPDSSRIYTWDFGDGNTGTGLDTIHTYAAGGNYLLCLTTFDPQTSCMFTYCDSITVTAPASCNASFNVNATGLTANYTATPVNPGWTYSWDLGDSGTASGTTTSHTYASAGTYVVCLTVTDSANGCSFTYCDSVTVTAPAATCNSAFNYNDNNGFTFFEASTLDSSWTYSWDFGDGNFAFGATAFNAYSASGAYNVCLYVSDSLNNCSSIFCDSIFITVPTCSVSYTYTIDTTGTADFTAAPFSANAVYEWDFGDFSPPTYGSNVTHSFMFSGDYVVCVTLTDTTNGCTSSYCDTVTVVVPPNCNSTFTSFPFNANVTFTVQPVNPGITYTFDFGDGTTAPVNGFGFAFHTYAASGTYWVCLNSVDSAGGCSSQYCDSVTVVIPGCTLTADFTITNLTVGKIQVTATAANPFYNYTWTFMAPPPEFAVVTGFGISDTAHTFLTNGPKQVCLKIDDFLSGCADSLCKPIMISGISVEETDALKASLSLYPNPAPESTTLEFTLLKKEHVTVSILDLRGKKVFDVLSSEINPGKNHILIPLDQLAKGMYLMQIRAGESTVLERLVRE